MRCIRSAALAFLLALIAAPVFAQAPYPDRPIHIIVAVFPPAATPTSWRG